VKALLDSRATGLFADKSFIEKHGFRKEKLTQPIEVKNIDRTSNKGGRGQSRKK